MDGLLFPGSVLVGIWKRLIQVSWNEVKEVVELGLWSRLSRAPTVNNPFRRQAGDTTPSSANLSQAEVPILNLHNPIIRNADAHVV